MPTPTKSEELASLAGAAASTTDADETASASPPAAAGEERTDATAPPAAGPIDPSRVSRAQPRDPYLDTVLQDRYRILSKIGEGGMGAVYLAVHTLIERKLAIKILSQDFARKPDLVQRFLQEARAAARIGHENIVGVTDFGETDSGSVYIVMEYLEGCDLAQAIRAAAPGTVPLPRVRHIMLQICRALYAAHQKGIIHRDLKPENIFLVNRDGHEDFIKILDFGIAKMSNIEESSGRLTRTGMIFGTPEYMSPEQARGDAPDHRVDIYALGCILYEMLTGSVPFAADTFMGVLTKQMFEPLEPPSRRLGAPLPRELEETCLRALEKERDRRFQSMQTMAQALEGDPAALGGVVMAPIAAGNSSRSYRMQAPPPMQGPPSFPGAPPPPSGPVSAPGPVPLQPEALQSPSMVSQSGIPYAVPQGLSGSYAGNYPVPLNIAPQGLPISGPPSRSSDETTQSALPLPGSPRTARVIAIVIGALFGVIVLLVVLLRQRDQDKDGPHGTTGGSGAPNLILPQGQPQQSPATPAKPPAQGQDTAPPPAAKAPQAPPTTSGDPVSPPPAPAAPARESAPAPPAKATPAEATPRKQKPARPGQGATSGPPAPSEEPSKPTPRGLRDPFPKQ